MSEDQGRPKDAGEAIREGIRSITGMLGALKEAIEDTFDELRGVDSDAAEGSETASASAFRKAQETVEEVRERLDFVTRREFEALRKEVEELRARLDGPRAAAGETAEAAAAGEQTPPAGEGSTGGGYRFEVD